MAQAVFKYGSPDTVYYTPTVAVAAGDVIVTADTTRIAHIPIAANILGALGASGGVYQVAGDAAIAADKKVYWVDATNKVSESAAAGANKVFGTTVTACTANAALCHVRHDPSA